MNGGTYMATLKDVAARAGVSIAAVSYCINGTHNLNPETKARIQNAIKELNYIPNSHTQSEAPGVPGALRDFSGFGEPLL